MNQSVAQRLSALRIFFATLGLKGWIVPTADPHLSEYVDEHYAFRKWLSGFTGSAGALLVTEKTAALLTDSRYWVQAEKQLEGSEILLLKLKDGFFEDASEWFAEQLKRGDCIGIPACLISESEKRSLANAFSSHGLKLSCISDSAEKRIWEDRPAINDHSIFDHTVSPRSRKEKLSALRTKLKEAGAQALLVGKLDNIAWIFNLRGSDVPNNPVFYAYALIKTAGPALLFIRDDKVPAQLREKLASDGVSLLPYEALGNYLTLVSEDNVLIDPEEINSELFSRLPEKVIVIEAPNPIELMKSVKTEEEVSLIEEAMVKDAVALVKFYAWLDENLGKVKMTEGSVAEKLLSFRKELPGFVSLSFETISAFGANAALPHYQNPREGGAEISGSGFLLIDSGAQFPEGTTDITRTKLIGEASELMKEDYTSVLKANIQLAKAIFPEGISSQLLDPISRAPIWQHFANFGHGTGHGVGFFLNVHEGPQRISYPRIGPQKDAKISRLTAMTPGVVTSDEPGIYRPGRWGIRIENLIAAEFAGENEFGRFLKFRTLTLCPIDLSAVISEWLDSYEKKWLNEYHARVRQRVLPHLQDETTITWLIKNTREI